MPAGKGLRRNRLAARIDRDVDYRCDGKDAFARKQRHDDD
jgi:hypothetical protein